MSCSPTAPSCERVAAPAGPGVDPRAAAAVAVRTSAPTAALGSLPMNVSVWSPPAVLIGLAAFLWVAVWLDRLVEQPPVTTPVGPETAHEGRTNA